MNNLFHYLYHHSNVNGCNGFDFEYIESFISFIFGCDIFVIENIFN